MRFVCGKGQKVGGYDLDDICQQLVKFLESYRDFIGPLNPNEIAADWINDLLYLTGHAELDEVKPVGKGPEPSKADTKEEK